MYKNQFNFMVKFVKGQFRHATGGTKRYLQKSVIYVSHIFSFERLDSFRFVRVDLLRTFKVKIEEGNFLREIGLKSIKTTTLTCI